MRDRYQQLVTSAPGRFVARRVGLPQPPVLRRYRTGDPVAAGQVVMAAAPGGRLLKTIRPILAAASVCIREPGPRAEPRPAGVAPHALVFDATGITRSEQLHALLDFFGPLVRSVAAGGRIVVLGTPPEHCADGREATAQRALEGFTRSVGKEVKRGITSQLVYVAPGAEDGLESTLRFLLSARSAYVSGQVIRVGPAPVEALGGTAADWATPLTGKVAVVTGAARGIGAAIVGVLARDGANVVCVDVPAAQDALAAVAAAAGGSTLTLDVTAEAAPHRLAEHLSDAHGGVDIVVHNAGVTRDRTLGRMEAARWDLVLNVNLTSEERINDVLLENGILRGGGRIIATSSIAGIAGNPGQTNYATSKAGVIGMVHALAPTLAARGGTINAVAPGFIETRMTAAVPLVIREAGRRMNSMTQGGRPIDVAETVAWFAGPGSAGVNGNVVRVCGQSLLGA